jgi:V/A-type H+-transporting ATPase subunit I
MTATSIICTKKDVESVLESLNTFGEFHIEPSGQDDANIAQYNANIQLLQERIFDVDALTKQLIHEKGSLLGIFKVNEPKKINVNADNWQSLLEDTSQQILTLKGEVDGLNSSLSGMNEKNLELMHLKKVLQSMQNAGADLETVGDLKLVYVAFASMPLKNCDAFQVAISGQPFFVKQSQLTEDECFLCVASSSKHKEEVERILRTYHADLFQMPPDLPNNVGEALKQVNQQLKDNETKETAVNEKLNRLGEENSDRLASLKETAENILTLLTAEKKILQTGRLATVKGFVPDKKFNELTQTVNSKMEGKALVLKDETAEGTTPPTKVVHGRFVKPFEEIVKLYGLPNYNEVDPTPLVALTFPILFGLMFGDLGHGLILLIGGAIVGSLIKGNQSIKNVCWIMAACGIAASVAGLLFGEAFGFELPWGPLWFSPFHSTETVTSFLIFSLFVGMVQINMGIAIELANYLLKHNKADAFLTALPKMLFFIGGIWLIYTYQLDFGAWLAGPILVPVIPFVIMVAGKPLYTKIAKPPVTHESEHPEQETLVGRLFEGGDFFTRLLGNTISYSRILALLMAHWALLLAVNNIFELTQAMGALGLVLGVLVIVVGNIGVLALEGLIVFIHTLRLHFYEWFSKFYGGAGTEFNPFKQKFSHTALTMAKKKE